MNKITMGIVAIASITALSFTTAKKVMKEKGVSEEDANKRISKSKFGIPRRLCTKL